MNDTAIRWTEKPVVSGCETVSKDCKFSFAGATPSIEREWPLDDAAFERLMSSMLGAEA